MDALRISRQQHRVEILNFALMLLESYQKSLDQLLPDIEIANKTLSDQLEHFTLNASKNDDYGKKGELRQLDVESFGVLADKISQTALLDYLKEGHNEGSRSRKWDAFINNCISKADEKFWNGIDSNIYSALVTIISSDCYGDAEGALEQRKFNSSTKTLYNIFSLLNSGYVSGLYNNALHAREVAGYYYNMDYSSEDEFEEEKEGECRDLRTLSEKLLAVIPTDRVFAINDDDAVERYIEVEEAEVWEEEGVELVIAHQHELPVYNGFKLIRISGFDQYVVLRKSLPPQLVDDLNSLYEKFMKLVKELESLLNLVDRDIKSQADAMAKTVLERKIYEKYELISPQFLKMAGFLRAIVEMDSKIVIEGIRVDNSLNTEMFVSKELSYKLGFSHNLIEFIRDPK